MFLIVFEAKINRADIYEFQSLLTIPEGSNKNDLKGMLLDCML